MKTKANLRMRRLGNRFMIVDSDTGSKNTTAVHSLNETAAEIWQFAEANPGFTAEDIAGFLTRTFDVDPETALADAQRITGQWIKENLIIE